MFLISKNKQANKKQEYKKSKTNPRRIENISGKSIKNNKFAAPWVKVFLVTHVSGNKSFFWPWEQMS